MTHGVRMGHKTFIPLENPEQLESLLARSQTHPVVIFKHSGMCGTSAQAYDELEAFVEEEGSPEVYVVEVLDHRPLSQKIAARFGVRHESPQVLIVAGGQVGWHGSHYRVTADTIRRALLSIRTPLPDK
jgi:bacillithiol system protein YtxJ